VFRLSATDSTVDTDSLSLVDRILTFVPVYVNYITQTLTSFELTTNDAVKIWSQYSSGIYALYVLLFVLLLGAQYNFGKKKRVIAAGFLWFNLFLIPVSQIIPILHFRADRFLYLPSIGFVVALVYIGLYYYHNKNWRKYRRPAIYLFGILILVFIIRIWDRNKDFSSDQVMFGKLIKHHPECREAQGFVGNHFLKKGDYEYAQVHINKALASREEYISFVDEKSNSGNLGVVYMHQGKIGQALNIFNELRKQESYNPEIDFNIGICYKKQSKYLESKLHLEKYLAYSPNNLDALFNLGAIGVELNDQKMIRNNFSQYLKLNPTSEYRATIEKLMNQ